MSFKSWKKEFYTKDASEYINKTDEKCLKHSILKWKGALPENVEKHQVTYEQHAIIENSTEQLSYTGWTCALCRKYSDFDPPDDCNYYSNPPDDCSCYSNQTDEYCPIVRVKGSTCAAIYKITRNNPTEMIQLLEDVLEGIKQ